MRDPKLLRLLPIAPRLRGLWLALALVFCMVQLGLPAHEASHPIGQADTACQFCMMGGHAPAMPNALLPLQPAQFMAEAPRDPVDRPAFCSIVRTRYSRGPPQVVDA